MPPLFAPINQPLHPRQKAPCPHSNPNDESDGLSWLRKAMNTTATADASDTSPPRPQPPLKPGLSGFVIDPQRGFLAIVSNTRRAIPIVIQPSDKIQVTSAEALCLIQLAGGMDLGTVVPPDALSRAVGGSGVTLRRIRAVANDGPSAAAEVEAETTATLMTEERQEGIRTNAPKIHAAVKNLPGLTTVSLEDVCLAMRECADDGGGVNDRATFTVLLDVLRDIVHRVPASPLKFVLTVTIIDNDGIKERDVEDVGVLEALAFSLRYKVAVEVDDVVLGGDEGFDAEEMGTRYPNFRSLDELWEDAKIMEGFIPSMFAKAVKRDEEEI
eukprot:CAMPEP_0172506530 /NCGR_PEP_ID=MMETSP1066-20121228/195838_1 /TAXON_ID=671091 /ORGANISM="Coscinodiscus wailesii, Strain CCMP2513" /LENGTH=327 /DNA_ID=CAMNT_0013283593 /DNA_START=132 /DNA_END=1115 /DNA_ORIENTATION=-